MKRQNLTKVIGSAATVFCLLSVSGQQAQAGQFHNGWNYAIDSFADGNDGYWVGSNSVFESYGMAMMETEDSIVFAINSNLALEGDDAYSGAMGGGIGWGDMILNFSGSSNFESATDLYGIRFAEGNDSGVSELGLYSNITTTSVATANYGYSQLSDYNYNTENYYRNSDDFQGYNRRGRARYGNGTASLADLAADTSYFDQSQAGDNVIASGTRIADIELINDFSGLGLDFGNFGAVGTHTFGFSVDKSFLPTGDFIAHLFEECNNDGMALVGNISVSNDDPIDIPEPTAMAGLAVVGLGFLSRRRKGEKAA